MKLKREQYEEIAVTLENECNFYYSYTSRAPRETFGQRRQRIQGWIWSSRPTYPSWTINRPDIEDLDQLRRYFDKRWGVPQTEPNKYADLKNVFNLPELYRTGKVNGPSDTVVTVEVTYETVFEDVRAHHAAAQAHLDCVKAQLPPDCVSNDALATSPINQETIVSKPIEITTKTLINGVDISTMSDSQVYDLIADQEAKIKELEKIEAKPKKLTAEIAKRQAGIAALVAHLDATEVK